MLANQNLKWKSQLQVSRTPVSPVAHGDSQGLPEQCEQPVTAGDSAGDSGSGGNSTQSSEPAVEPEDTEPGDCQWGGDLGVAELSGGAGRLEEGGEGYAKGT